MEEERGRDSVCGHWDNGVFSHFFLLFLQRDSIGALKDWGVSFLFFLSSPFQDGLFFGFFIILFFCGLGGLCAREEIIYFWLRNVGGSWKSGGQTGWRCEMEMVDGGGRMVGWWVIVVHFVCKAYMKSAMNDSAFYFNPFFLVF